MDTSNCCCETCKLRRLVARAISIFEESRPAIERGVPSAIRRMPIESQIELFKKHAAELGVNVEAAAK